MESSEQENTLNFYSIVKFEKKFLFFYAIFCLTSYSFLELDRLFPIGTSFAPVQKQKKCRTAAPRFLVLFLN